MTRDQLAALRTLLDPTQVVHHALLGILDPGEMDALRAALAACEARVRAVEAAREAGACRACGAPMGGEPATYDYGAEYAHTRCLEADHA